MSPQLIGPLIGISVAIVILVLRMRRGGGQSRPLKMEQLWIAPAIFVALAGYFLFRLPPAATQWPWLGLAAGLGAIVGWARGSMMRITVNPETHALNQQASPAALIFLLGLLLVRTGLRNAAQGEGRALGIDPIFVTDLFLLFAVGMIVATRVEMALRARRLRAAARAARIS